MRITLTNIPGINLKTSPFASEQGQVFRAVNVQRDVIGGWEKRPGYVTFLGTPDNSEIDNLFSWTRNNGTQTFVYRNSGGTLYHSLQGTGAWTISPGGTFTIAGTATPSSQRRMGFAVLEDNMILGNGTDATRHTTTGTNFTNTTSAPIARYFAEYENRIWAGGTASNLFYSTTGTLTDWTTDSSSITIPGAGRINGVIKVADRLNITKNSGAILRYDGFRLTDLSTNLGPSDYFSMGEIEDFRIYTNKLGVFGFNGGRPELLSNVIEKQIYNDGGSAIAGTQFNEIPAVVHQYQYYASVGTITEDFTNQTILNAILRYGFQTDEFVNWQFFNRPRSFGTFQDNNQNVQMIFGDVAGQAYQLSGTATTDNGNTIPVELMGFIHGNSLDEKKWNFLRVIFNPGCQAKVQIALSDTFTYTSLVWQDVGVGIDGLSELHFPSGSRGRFLFWRIYESSRNSRFQFYVIEADFDPIVHN